MARNDPHLLGITSNGSQAIGVADLKTRMAVQERTGGGSGGTGGSVVDATTVIKGKLQLAGHLAGTAAAPILNTTSAPQTARFGFGVAADATVPVKVQTPSQFANSVLLDGATASYRATISFSQSGNEQWRLGKETSDAFRLFRSGTYPTTGGFPVGVDTVPFEVATTGQTNFKNYVKLWGTNNATFGTIALDIGGTMDDAIALSAPVGYTEASRLVCTVTSFTNGLSGTRGGVAANDTILFDNPTGTDGTSWTPINFQTSVSPGGFTDRGSLNPMAVIGTMQEFPGADCYGEFSCFNANLQVQRRGTLCMGGEAALLIYDVASGGTRRGPARAHGWASIIADNNAYATYNNTAIFGADSTWLKSGARGYWAASTGLGRAGTAFYAAGSHAFNTADTQDWERAFVVNVGSNVDFSTGVATPGTDRMTIKGDGSVYVGPDLTADVLGGAINGIALNYSATAPTLRVMGTGNNAFVGVAQTSDTHTRARLSSQARLEFSQGTNGPLGNLNLTTNVNAATGTLDTTINTSTSAPTDPIVLTGDVSAWGSPSLGNPVFFVIENETFAAASLSYNGGTGKTTLSNISRTGTPVGATAHTGGIGTVVRQVTNGLRMHTRLEVDGKLSLGTGTLDAYRRTSQMFTGLTTFRNGDNSNRTAGNATDNDQVGGTPLLPVLVDTDFDDLGSLNNFCSFLTLEPYSGGGDVYAEGYSFVANHTINRRGANSGGFEAGMGISSGAQGRVLGMSAIIGETNAYSSYTTTIFGALSPWVNTGAIGFAAIAPGAERSGTALWIAGNHASAGADTADWERAIVVNVGSISGGATSAPGVEVFTVDGEGNIGVGATATVNQTVNNTTHKLPAALVLSPGSATPTTAAAGAQFGTDSTAVNIYRGAADVLSIGDSIGVGLTASPASGSVNGVFLSKGTNYTLHMMRAAGGSLVDLYANGDTNARVRLFPGGTTGGIQMGPGNAATDITIARSAGGALTVSSALTVAGATTVNSNINIGGTAGAGFIAFASQSATPTPPATSGAEIYVKSAKLVIAYNDAGTTNYFSIDGTLNTGTQSVTNHGTTAP